MIPAVPLLMCSFPAIKISDDHYVIPLYNFNYAREQQIIAEEEGGYSVQQTL